MATMTPGEFDARPAELVDRARADHDAGLYRDALETARELLGFLDAIGELAPIGEHALPRVAACAIGARCLSELGDPPGALELIDQGRAGTDASDVESRLELDAAAGQVLARSGRVEAAIALLESAFAACRDLGSDAARAASLEALASAYVAGGRYDVAIARAEEAIACAERAGTDQARSLTTLARAYLGAGNLDRAEAEYERALELARQREARGTEGWVLLAGGEIAARRGDRARTEQRLDDAQEIAEELSMMPLVERCRATLRRALQAERTSESSRRSES